MISKNTIDIAREIQALAQSGLTFTKDLFDRERYEHLQKLAVQLVLRSTSHTDEYIAKIFSVESGYATPKLDARSAVFNQNKILLIKERDSRKWTLPGGYIDVNETLSEAAAREVLEETGYSVSVNKIAAIFDHRLHGHKPHLYH